MAFTINDTHGLTRLLVERPEWLSGVRRIVLTDELLSLPEIVRGLAKSQGRTEEQVAKLTHTAHRLAGDVRGMVLEAD
ncbi:MAG: hypothetical protein RMN25_05085 [Anaerolineae bacterium]|nr:hypothetical protein [Thermoflexales bacterium]MDW8407139.1 hypothetical protein [Anaerolineae bacterium]